MSTSIAAGAEHLFCVIAFCFYDPYSNTNFIFFTPVVVKYNVPIHLCNYLFITIYLTRDLQEGYSL